MLRELKKKDWLSMLGLSENMIPKALILRGTRNLRNQYENYHTHFTDVINIKSPNNLLEDIFVGKLEGVSVAYASVYGSSMAADVVHVFGVLGTSLVLQTGCCGALADGIRMGDLFIATEAYRGEGASAYYNPEANIVKASFKADKLPLIQKVHDVTVHSGRIYTTSALFMEGKEQVEDWSNKGCTAVDMETAATFAVANYFRMGSAAILYVFDNPRYETDIVTSDNEKDKKRDLANKRMMELTFEIVKSYYSKKKCLRTAHRKKVRMGKITNIKFPADINWRSWIERWDKMQDYYIARRAERFDLMVRLIADTQETVSQVLDIGCGTGSLMLPILERFQESEVCGIDFDETLLLLAEKRLAEFNGRAHLIQADLRDQSWTKLVPAPIDAAVSATALHWLSREQLARFYDQLAKILRPGGIFLNADHVGNKSLSIQKGWENHREQVRQQEADGSEDDWEGFWDAYGRVLKIDIKEYRGKLTEPWEGSEEGLPLEWHFEKLTESGFKAVDCFWRYDCDAIYGGIRE